MATVKVNPPPPPVQETYTVELTRAEARALSFLLSYGVSADTRMGLGLSTLSNALGNATGYPRALVDGLDGGFVAVAQVHPRAEMPKE